MKITEQNFWAIKQIVQTLNEETKMNSLSERLHSWAQNEEMINQYFTEHGKDCNRAATELSRLYQVEHLAWHVCESAELDFSDNNSLVNRADLEKLSSLLPEEHPFALAVMREKK